MTQEEKDLLLKDLGARLPYGVRIYTKEGKKDVSFVLRISDLNWIFEDDRINEMYDYDGWKPYLRPMSSMAEEEKKEISILLNYEFYIDDDYALVAEDDRHRIGLDLIQVYIDWLNSHYFDYRGLIEKGLALEAPEGMYDKKGE